MINCVIIENESEQQEILIEKLERLFPQLIISAVIEKKSEAIQYLNNTDVQLVFMDTNVKGGTCISILDQVHFIQFSIIFTSTHEKCAIQAINRGVCYYLLKPFSDVEFIKSVTTALAKIRNQDRNDSINIMTNKGVFRVLLENVFYLKSDGPYTKIYTSDNKYLSTKNLGYYESILSNKLFFRCHNSFIVNSSKVKTLNKGRSGELELENNIMIPISQRRRTDFFKFLGASQNNQQNSANLLRTKID